MLLHQRSDLFGFEVQNLAAQLPGDQHRAERAEAQRQHEPGEQRREGLAGQRPHLRHEKAGRYHTHDLPARPHRHLAAHRQAQRSLRHADDLLAREGSGVVAALHRFAELIGVGVNQPQAAPLAHHDVICAHLRPQAIDERVERRVRSATLGRRDHGGKARHQPRGRQCPLTELAAGLSGEVVYLDAGQQRREHAQGQDMQRHQPSPDAQPGQRPAPAPQWSRTEAGSTGAASSGLGRTGRSGGHKQVTWTGAVGVMGAAAGLGGGESGPV